MKSNWLQNGLLSLTAALLFFTAAALRWDSAQNQNATMALAGFSVAQTSMNVKLFEFAGKQSALSLQCTQLLQLLQEQNQVIEQLREMSDEQDSVIADLQAQIHQKL